MLKATLLVCAGLAVFALPAAAQLTTPADDVAGTWTISLEGHQIGLVLEQDGRTVTGTLIMGKDVPVDGEFADRALTLTGPAAVGSHGDQQTVPMKITATLKDDGTLDGEMNTAHGPMKWTAERLERRK
jgi:hypothetical protein